MQNTTLTEIKTKPSLAFLGTGWIGLNRMQSLLDNDLCTALAVIDNQDKNVKRAIESAPDATSFTDYQAALNKIRPEGVVIATPSALHAEQSIMALEKQIPVFCQKPLGRTIKETTEVVKAAEKNDVLLGVDFSYRFTKAIQAIYKQIQDGALGDVYSIDLTFHNAYGPDKPWFYDPALSGGGCVIDLGIHLIDLALWMLDFPEITKATSNLYAGGKLLHKPAAETEDYATAVLTTKKGQTIRLTCSWNLPAGQDAVIEANVWGKKAGAAFKNINGSFYDFEAHLYNGTQKAVIASPPDDWGGQALKHWAKQLSNNGKFDPQAYELVEVARAIDKIYGRYEQG